ncbi:hypothetical protein IJO12_07505 [bacterium]|nr:hypothetical protein [bacterium]
MKLSKDFAKEFYSNARMKPLYLTKTHPMGNLNVHNLGLIYPNGRIKFSNNDAVFNYVKNKCVKALNLKTPYEYGIAVSGHTVLDEAKGDISSCTFTPENYESNVVLYHGHPDMYKKGASTPVSLPDFKLLARWKNVKAVVAFNSKGEYSKIVKTNDSSGFLPNAMMHLKYAKIFLKEKNLHKKMNLYPILKRIQYIQDQISMLLMKGFKDDAEKMYKKLEETELELKHYKATKKDCLLIHNFWKKNAKKLGIYYETNFSDLVNK